MTISKQTFAGLLSAALLSMASAACGIEPGDAVRRPDASAFEFPIVGVRGGHLTGTLGTARVDAGADPLALYSTPEIIRVVAVAQTPQRAVMLQMSASANEVGFLPGTIEHYTATDTPAVALLGCVGQALDVYDEFDAPADQVDLAVDQAPDGDIGDVSVVVTGTWLRAAAGDPPEGRVASLSFVLVR